VQVNYHNTIIEEEKGKDKPRDVRVFGVFRCSIQLVVGRFVLFFRLCDFGAFLLNSPLWVFKLRNRH